MDYLVGAIACAIAFSIVGIVIGYLGPIGFLAAVGLFLLIYALGDQLPLARWRWRYRNWRAGRK